MIRVNTSMQVKLFWGRMVLVLVGLVVLVIFYQSITRASVHTKEALDYDDAPWGQSWSDVYRTFKEISKLALAKPSQRQYSVDLRVIVLTQRRPRLLNQSLMSLQELDLDGDKAAMEIWIDRDELTERLEPATEALAHGFQWQHGPVHVRVRDEYMGVYNQWITTWRPNPAANEIAIFVEDGVVVSPLLYRWIKHVHRTFSNQTNISSYCPAGNNWIYSSRPGQVISEADNYLYRGFSSIAFAPHPARWMEFQDWFTKELPNIKSGSLKPHIAEDHDSTLLYKVLEIEHQEINMWSLWFEYYCHINDLWSIQPNIPGRTLALQEHGSRSPQYHDLQSTMNKTSLLKCNEFSLIPVGSVTYKINYDGKPMSTNRTSV